jgi:DNA-directed RNA polymerase specialized sigma24 family protein
MQKMEEVKIWLDIKNMKERGEIDVVFAEGKELFRLGQIRSLSMKFGNSEEQILDWLRGKSRPPLVDQIVEICDLKESTASSRHSFVPRREIDTDEVHRLQSINRLSEREIARLIGVSRNQVRKALRDWDVHWRYYTNRHTLHRIACDLNLSITTLRGIFRNNGWQMQVQTKRKKLSKAEIRKLHHEEGLTFVQIAERSGVDLDIIRRAIGVLKVKNTTGEIGSLYFQEGLAFNQISRHMKVSLKTIRRAFRKQKWTPRISSRTKQLDPDWVYHLYYFEGFSHPEIADILSVHNDTIRKLFLEQGWTPRNVQRSKKRSDIDMERREYQRKRRLKLKAARLRIFGTKCYACHSDTNTMKNHHLHRKDGMEHDRNQFRSLKRLESLNPDEWVPLCDRCHLGVTMLMKVFRLDWDKIEQILARRKKTSGKLKESLELPNEDAPISKEYRKLSQDFEGTISDLKKAIFGETCSLCGCESESKSLTLHRKDGQAHHPSMTSKKKYLQKLNPTEWTHVCHDCHNVAQWALDKLGIEWSDLSGRLKKK